MVFLPFRSMKNRLIVMFLAFSVLVYLLIASILETSLKHHFYQQDFQHAQKKFESVNWLKLREEPPERIIESVNLAVDFWIISNEEIIGTNSGIPLEPGMPEAFLNDFKQGEKSPDWHQNNSVYRPFVFDAGSSIYVLMVLEINEHINFFRQLRTILLWSVGIVALLAVAYSIVVVHLGLKPIRVVQNHLKQVSTNNLDVVIPLDNLPVELRDLVQVQNDMLHKLRLGFSRLSEFSSDIAHELKTPLSNISTQSQVTLSSHRSAEEYREVLLSNLEEIGRISKTIDDILYIAKAENSLILTHDVPVNVRDEIERIVDFFSILGDEKSVFIKTVGDAVLSMDKNMLERAVNNLLSNALRHADMSSVINIRIEDATHCVFVSVENTGDVIPSAALPFIFDRFYRVDKSRRNDGSIGGGLGLAITRSIMDACGGRISVISENGSTKFTLEFPK
ncbi:heavy metal sensor histidine kinase [Parasalinivibrio latis]|uniref:heavy metal sensor histidine kinase n=1 Tax=Parasalinivibrio latis TaxID=2952610 RepID=UPI0030E3359B